MTNKENFHIRFNDFGESNLNILVIFHLMVPDYAAELREREEILLKIMDLAEELGVEFAFPTRTLHVETRPTPARSSGKDRGLAAARVSKRPRPGVATSSLARTRMT
jgi:small-conductance mechanosensitive channel